MTDPEIRGEEFDRLLSTFCDSALSAPDLMRLNWLVRSDPDLRQRYLLYMGVHATLNFLIADNSVMAAGTDGQAGSAPLGQQVTPGLRGDRRRPAWRVPRRVGGLAASALVLVAGLAGAVGWWRAHRGALREVRQPGPIVARITGGAGVRFDGLSLPLGANERLRTGTYRLVEGIVEVTMARGAQVMVTAPAEFELQSDERLVLMRGKLSAKVPEEARGFTVETPSATLVDVGTEFAADVDREGNGEVHVFRGEVIVKPRSRRDSRPLRLGEARATRVDAASATPSGIEVDSTRFLRRLDEPATGYSRMIDELGPVSYLRMEPTVDGNSLIDSIGTGSPGRLIRSPSYGTPWLPGCFGTSLRLRGPSFGDYATLPFVPRRFGNTLSVAAWVFAESRPRWASIVKRWGMPGDRCFHFGLSGDDGDLEVHISGPDGAEPLAREGRPLPTGRWHHVAFVADGKALRLYRNGVEVAKADQSGLNVGSLKVLSVGAKLNPNGVGADAIEPGYWHGRVDEISIFARPLEAATIRKLHQAAELPGQVHPF
jgi:hypothetical protein